MDELFTNQMHGDGVTKWYCHQMLLKR